MAAPARHGQSAQQNQSSDGYPFFDFVCHLRTIPYIHRESIFEAKAKEVGKILNYQIVIHRRCVRQRR